ncbi:MAG: hypothetical protein WC700_09150 [Gemmatimonadaceae bacterium]|jgi:hypothetical protein
MVNGFDPGQHERFARLLAGKTMRAPGETYLDVHRKTSWSGAVCRGCRSPATWVQIKCFKEADAFVRDDPVGAAVLMEQHQGKMPIYPTQMGSFVPVTQFCFCQDCSKPALAAAARTGSDWLVEVDEATAAKAADQKTMFGVAGQTGGGK